jgi:hypothetical protein
LRRERAYDAPTASTIVRTVAPSDTIRLFKKYRGKPQWMTPVKLAHVGCAGINLGGTLNHSRSGLKAVDTIHRSGIPKNSAQTNAPKYTPARFAIFL